MVQNHSWFDKQSVLFPYSSSKSCTPPIRVVAAHGSYLHLEDGKRILDGISSWWSVCHGYSNPHIIQKIKERTESLAHVMFCCDLIHEEAYKLATRLIGMSPEGMQKVFFADSGSMAIEAAMKIAVQYWCSMGDPEKRKFIFFRNAYHGDSMGCMSISDPQAIHGILFQGYYPEQYLFDIPNNEEEAILLGEHIESIKDEVAAMVLEPILQAAGGMHFHSPKQVRLLREIAAQNKILFIADEVATGFGRLGTMFACNQASISPDILVVGKAITGGTCPLSAVIVSSAICEQFSLCDSSPIHGNTFMANPIACAAANASLDLFQNMEISSSVGKIEKLFKQELEELKHLDHIHNVRIKGAVAAVDVDTDFSKLIQKNLTERLVELGIWLRPIKNVIYLMPQFSMLEEDLLKLTAAFKAILLKSPHTTRSDVSVC